MADRTVELDLLLKAKDLSGKALGTMADGLDNVKRKVGKTVEALEGMGRATAVGLGMAAETLLQGGSLGEAAVQLGIHMASELTETFGEQAIAKFTGSALLATITAPIAALGSTIGGILAAAVPIGMALLPVLLIGAIVAAVAVLIFNEEIRNKVFAFIGQVLSWIGDKLGELGQVFLDAVNAVWHFISHDVIQIGTNIVGGIIDGLASLPGKLADAVWSAIRSILPINIGPIHITENGITLDPIKIEGQQGDVHTRLGGGRVPGHASGGWVGLHGPELGIVGENGPEYIVPNGGMQQSAGVRIIGVTEAELTDMIERKLYFRLQRSAPTSLRR